MKTDFIKPLTLDINYELQIKIMWLVVVFICLGWILSLCLHEFGHALVAYWGGDTSVKDKGYLTLNPLKYTEPSLSLVMPLFFLLIGGIALPGGAVYINQNRLRNRRWKSAVSAAGPIADMIVACLLALPFQLGWYSLGLQNQNSVLFTLIISLSYIVSLNIYIVLINLLPIPALDGYGIIEPWLPRPIKQQFNQFSKYGIWVLIGLLWFAQPFNIFLWNLTNGISQFLGVPVDLAFMAGGIFRQSSQYLVVGIIVLLWIFRDKNKELQRQGDRQLSSQKYEQAIASYDKVIKNQPKNADAWYWRGYALSLLNKHDEAIASYDKVIELKSDNTDAWNYKGITLIELQRYEEALVVYEKAIEIKSDYPDYWYNKACCYALQGNATLATQNLQQAIKLGSNRFSELAKTDSNFDEIREHPLFKNLVDGVFSERFEAQDSDKKHS